MMTWLKTPPRRAARPARPTTPKSPAPVDDDMPPPFFADEDPAFLDMGEVVQTPPPLPAPPDRRLANALAALPAWPADDAPQRTEQLLEILRALDRIAGDVCTSMDRA